jgi:hypothetical protein
LELLAEGWEPFAVTDRTYQLPPQQIGGGSSVSFVQPVPTVHDIAWFRRETGERVRVADD